MKHTKIILLIFASLLLLKFELFAQDKLDKVPFPAGGIEELAKNVKYPVEAKEAKIQGKVMVKVVVDEKGKVVETTILQSVSHGLDEAAINAIKATKFTPGEKDGKKVKAEVVIPISFKLN
ncbi:MAG: energy transducer TonB [bacterium]